jgi:hypothetical protein
MKKAAVVIGVNKTGHLNPLNASVSGAKDFATWAAEQSYDVTLITDEDGTPVTVRDIFKAVATVVYAKTYSQLLIFFSGHGQLRGPSDELWLLTDAPDNPNEAVNVTGSISLARQSGLEHVVFISDACRSRPDGDLRAGVHGGVIFPGVRSTTAQAAIDEFYATMPGAVALEVPASEAERNFHAIFTTCILNGLRGDDPMTHEQMTTLPGQPWTVPSWKLDDYLDSKVPEVAASINVTINQVPDNRVTSRAPKFLAEIPPPPAEIPTVPPTTPQPSGIKKLVAAFNKSLNAGMGELPSDTQADSSKLILGPAIKKLIDASGRQSFETHTGFSVIGESVKLVIMADLDSPLLPGHPDLFQEGDPNVWHIRVRSDNAVTAARSVLIQFANGYGTLLAIIPGCIGTVLVEQGRVVNVNYMPSRGTPEFDEYQKNEKEIDRQRAIIAAAASRGIFRPEQGVEWSAANYLRFHKRLDPTLGLYAAYAYNQAGDIAEVKSVYNYMRNDHPAVLFDVALLAGELVPEMIPKQEAWTVSPACPMLTQGWAYLDSYLEWLPKAIVDVRTCLVPGLWTTFTSRGCEILSKAIQTKQIQ